MMLISFITKLTKYLLYFVFVFFMLSLLLVGIGLFTHAGNILILDAIHKLEPRLSITLNEGTILNAPTYEQIQWSDGEMLYEFNNASYEFNWYCLIDELCLDSLTLGSTNINIVLSDSPPKEDPKTNTEPFVLKFPIPVYIKHLDISNTNVKVAGVEIDVKNVLLSASGINNDLSLDATVTGLTVVLPDSKQSTIDEQTKQTPKYDQSVQSHFAAILKDTTLPEVILPFNGIANRLDVDGFKLVHNKKNIIVVNQAKSKFTYIGSFIDVDRLVFDLPQANLNLFGNIDLTARYPMDVNAAIDVKEWDLFQPADLFNGQHIKLLSKGDLGNLKSNLILSDLIDAEINNTIDLYTENLPHQLTIDWQTIRWPLSGKPQLTATAGSFSSKGRLNQYQLRLLTDYNIENLPTGKVDLNGDGNLQALTLTKLLINTLEGQLSLKGKLGWANDITWNGDLNINDINFDELNTEYQARLSGDIKQSVTIGLSDKNTTNWSFQLPEIALSGSLQDRPLTINGEVNGNNKNGINIQALDIINENNQVTINGQVADHNDLIMKVEIADLSKMVPNTKGSLIGDVNLLGSLDEIEIETALKATNISYLDNSAELMNLVGNVKLNALPKANLSLDINNMIVNKQPLASITINVSPKDNNESYSKHKINLGLDSDILATDLQFLFTQETDKWEAELNKGTVISKQGTWLLNKSFTVSVNNKAYKITPHCWASTSKENASNGKICVNNFSAGNAGNIAINIEDFQINTLSPFIPSELVLEGALNAGVNLLWKDNKKPDVNILIDGKAVALNIKSEGNEQKFIRYPVNELNLSVKSDKQQANFTFVATSENLLDLNFTGNLTPYKNIPEISAKLDLLVPDFNVFSKLIPEVDKLEGQLKSDFTISGQLQKPVLKGQILIADVAVNTLGLPIQITDLNAKVDVNNNTANIDGYFFSNANKAPDEKERTILNELVTLKDTAVNTVSIPQRIANMQNQTKQQQVTNGRANIKGDINWVNKLKGNIHFKAEQMYIQDYGKVELFVSPDINLVFDESVELEGIIKVDKGNITIKELPEGAVNVSKDIIVVDAEQKNDVADLPIKMDLKVLLGESLRVKAIGLDSYIHGDLLIQKPLLKTVVINGELRFSKGSYRALAQDLVIQNSRVVFQGQPDSPYLFIEAIRDPNNTEDNVTAGVRVTGTPEQLQLTLFSDPSMSQQDVLSYITRGRSIENSSEDGNSSQLAAVLIDIGAGKTDGLMEEIGGKIGIKDLSLASSGQGDEQSVGVRGTLAPGVEISYGVGVFDSFTILALRYELFEKFYIEASSGLYNAVDAYYEWDWE